MAQSKLQQAFGRLREAIGNASKGSDEAEVAHAVVDITECIATDIARIANALEKLAEQRLVMDYVPSTR